MHHSIKKMMLMKVVKNKYEQLHNVHLIILNEWIYFDLFPTQDTVKQRERRRRNKDETKTKEKQETSERINQRDASEKKEEQQQNER
jgi:hypothetical protein